MTKKITEKTTETITITVDGQPTSVRSDIMLLEALRSSGVVVPTLCFHPSLEPNGACRLCVVEISHPDWKGWSGLVTSCLYPVEPGLEVSTRSERVRAARSSLLELYLARCPDSEDVKALARSEGIDSTPYPPAPDADLCVHCGLCTRVCQELGPFAIAALGRGTDKVIGPRPDLLGEDCTGCLACAYICPTGEISSRHENGKLFIWNREFDVPVCAVQEELCRGCGVCEEVCPFDIPRVTAQRSGGFVATISAERCVGCGICAGACPTGAIGQDAYPDRDLPGNGDLRGKSVVYACSRSPLPSAGDDLIPVPCIGRVGTEHMLTCLARGADGVLVMCRDQASCPYGPGGALGEQRVAVASELAAAAGLGAERIRYVQPPAGRDGPATAWAAFQEDLTPTPPRVVYPNLDALPWGMDRALALLEWFQEQPELAPSLPVSLTSLGAELPDSRDTLLYLGNLPHLDLLLSLLIPHWRLREKIHDAVQLLRDKGVAARIVATVHEVQESEASRVIVFHEHGLPSWGRELEIVTLAQLAGADDTATVADDAAAEGTDAAPAAGDTGFRFQITTAERQRYIALLKSAPTPFLLSNPHLLAQFKLLTREGAWQEALFTEPLLAFTHALQAGHEGQKS